MLYEPCPLCDSNVVEGITSWPQPTEDPNPTSFGLCTVTPDGATCCTFLEKSFTSREEAETVALFMTHDEIRQLRA
jgi:hypothetical protein